MPQVRELSGPGSSSGDTSRSLIDRVRADDTEAWNRLVTLYAPLVAHWCRRWRLSDDDTADVFQEVFQSVALHIAAFRRVDEGDTFRGWLRTITTNKIHDFFRKQQREPRGIGGSEAQQRMTQFPAPSERGELASDASVSRSQLDSLRPANPPEHDPGEMGFERRLFRQGLELIRAEFEPRTWQAFWLTTVDGRAAKDVAADLGMSPGAVRVAKSRVLHRLRAELGDASP